MPIESMLQSICGANLFDSIFETLSVNLFSPSGKFAPMLGIVRSIYDFATTVGVMLMFIYFLVSFMDITTSENFSWEQLWRQFAMLIAAKFLMEHGFELLNLMFNFGMEVTAELSQLSGLDIPQTSFDAKAILDAYRAQLNLPTILSALGIDYLIIWIFLLIPWLASWLMCGFVSLICYGRVIEIYVRAAMAPIALSDFFNRGLQGSGWRFLKSFLAVCLQGATILIIAILYSKLFVVLTVDPTIELSQLILQFLIFYGAAVMLLFKSQALTKELMGIN